MRPRTLAVLFAVVLGFGAFIWLYERKLPSSEERAVRAKRVLAGVEKKDVVGVSIEGAGQRVRFERLVAGAGKDKDLKDTKDLKDDDKKADDEEPAYGWKLVEPLAARADAAAVNALVEGVLALEKTRTLEAVDRKATGLDMPEWKVRLKTADDEKVLELGAPVPPSGERIAALAGETGAYVVNDQLVNDLKKAPGDWRDRKLLPGDRERISRLALTAGGHSVVLAKQGGKLRLASPVADAAQRDKVDDLLFGLASLSADRFVDQPPPPAELGLTPPQAVVEATFPGQPPTRIEIGKEIPGAAPPPPMSTDTAEPPPPPEKSYYLRVGSQVYQGKASSLVTAANRPPAEWQSLALSGFEVHEVESAAVKTAKGKVELTRSDTDWKRGGTLISYMPVSDLLFALNGAKADRLATPEEAKALGARLDKPVFEVTLKGKSGEEVLSFYDGLKGAVPAVPARVEGRSAVLLLPPKAYAEIAEKWAAVEKAEPLQKGKDKT
jgi:hypothetical protein